MNRRTFLRSLATVCGAAVVCPGELLKGGPVTPIIGIRGERAKHIVIADLGEQRWPKYYAECHKRHTRELAEAFERAFWDTKFRSPLMRGIK
ncbi:hypothetical protein LCGC14_0437310 [marine sediment metagenome]|uniref:Uncharacterized protein n=1 Tax=marine sediment metagenome TaxID=412755 RepID=A0A0F9SLE2_9ZZZZ